MHFRITALYLRQGIQTYRILWSQCQNRHCMYEIFRILYHPATIIDLILNFIYKHFVILTIHVKYSGSFELPYSNQYKYGKNKTMHSRRSFLSSPKNILTTKSNGDWLPSEQLIPYILMSKTVVVWTYAHYVSNLQPPAVRNQQSYYVQMPVYLLVNVRRVDIADRMLLFYFSDRHCCNSTNHTSNENGC